MREKKGMKLIEYNMLGDERGSLVVIEENKNIPFKIKRAFYIFNLSNDVIRGKHANKKSKIFFIAVKGKCKILVDDGIHRENFNLNKPNIGLFTDNMTWKEMYDFSSDCVLLALSDSYYDASEYINDYNDFINQINKLG